MKTLFLTLLSLSLSLFQGCLQEKKEQSVKKSSNFTTEDNNSSESGDSTSSNSDLTSDDCPPGYIPVPESTEFSIASFCVMKYEAQDGGSSDAASVQGGVSLGGISGNSAFTRCSISSANGFDGTFRLISNDEWMVIARNIELESQNWTSGTVGSGMIFRGHSERAPNNKLTAGNDNDGYSGTGNSSSNVLGSGLEQRRTHNLSNGEIIWDFSGNLWEWVDWDISDNSYTILTTIESGCTLNGVWEEFPVSGCSSLSGLKYLPSVNSYDSSNGVGYFKEGTPGAVHRGGCYYNEEKAGIYSINLEEGPNYVNAIIGFRCVYHP